MTHSSIEALTVTGNEKLFEIRRIQWYRLYSLFIK